MGCPSRGDSKGPPSVGPSLTALKNRSAQRPVQTKPERRKALLLCPVGFRARAPHLPGVQWDP
jgi:hypothetical protein